jgi:DNA-binding MarR family transcriptional regulator
VTDTAGRFKRGSGERDHERLERPRTRQADDAPLGLELDRTGQIDYVAGQLLPDAALLVRLLVRDLDANISRTEAGVLYTLGGGSRRITELAELEGLAQPTMTLLIKRLEQQGLVRRERDPDDGRVVLVSVTEAGEDALVDFRARFSAALRSHLTAMSDEQVAALAAATETLGSLIAVLQRG